MKGSTTLARVRRAVVAGSAVAFALMTYVFVTLPDVRGLATTNPKTTAFMELRAREAAREGRSIRHVQRWVPYSRMSANLKRAVLVAEDSAFWDHEGIDFQQIRASIQVSLQRGQAIRGASTITQQLAKNLYLSPSRDPLRKLREFIIARRLEAELSKVRIFEIYLNVIEWGDGIWGAEAAARTYFGVSAAALNAEQAALLAGAIINPRALSPARPPSRLLRRQRIILSRLGGSVPRTPVPVPTPDVPPLEDSEEIPERELSTEPAPAPPQQPDASPLQTDEPAGPAAAELPEPPPV
jgi:monofunctional biosynthetic peptidoglycan transglycosylase